MSEETTAYNAELWCDGRKVADLSNDGKGGSDREYWTDHGRTVREAIEAHLAAMPPVDVLGKPMAMDLELWVGKELEKEEERKWIARAAKTKTVFRLNSDPDGGYRTLGTRDRSKAEAFLNNKYGATTYTIIA